jgi:hypothetical protein
LLDDHFVEARHADQHHHQDVARFKWANPVPAMKKKANQYTSQR